MSSVRELRESLSSQQRVLLDEIWNHFLSQKEWPAAWEFHSPNRKAVVRETLRSLNGSIVIEISDSQYGGRYQLTLLGVLLTSDGQILERLLVRYLEYLRKRYQTRPKERTIRSTDVQTDLRLGDEETKLLGRLVLLGNLYSGSAGYSTNWESKEWSAGIFEKVEDFPPEGTLDGEIGKLVLQGCNADTPVFLEERRGRTSWNPQGMQPAVSGSPSEADPRTVFVVHGRNEIARKSMFDFLRAIGLNPLEWSQAVSATGEATPYIGQVLDTAFSMAQAVVVLMTPDDEACLKKEYQSDHDEQFEKQPTGQARPNVLFEAGMAMGRDPKRTVLVQIGDLRPFSDVGGRHVLRLDNSSERRQDLAERLKVAGCPVNLTGREWHKTGSFVLDRTKATLPPKAKEAVSNLADRLNAAFTAINANLGQRLTPQELEIIDATPDHGWIHVFRSDAHGQCVITGVDEFFRPDDASYQAKYLNALESLLAKSLVRPEGQDSYRLTGRGFEIRKGLKAAGGIPKK
jgi:predicted nucleotide-binding protein